MKKTGILILIVFIAIIGGMTVYHHIAIPKEEGIAHLRPQSYKNIKVQDIYCHSYSRGEKNKPAEFCDVPKDLSKIPAEIFYHKLAVGKNIVLAAGYKPDNSQRPKLWIDTNMDNRLSDEESIVGIKKSESYNGKKSYYFDYGTFCLETKTFKSAPISLISDIKGNFLSISPVQGKTGKILLNNQTYQVALGDGDYDGHYNTCYTPTDNYRYPGCDVIGVNRVYKNVLGCFTTGKSLDSLVPLGRYFWIDNTYYKVDVSPDGNTLRLHKEEPVMGTLRIHNDVQIRDCRVFSDACTQWIKMKKDNIQLPVGHYKINYGQLRFTDPNGNRWDMGADFDTDIRKGRFEIVEGQTVTLNPGPPFTVKSEVSKQDEGKLGIHARLVGNEGEEYGLRISRSSPEPQLKILNENKEEIHSGQMEYG